MNDDDVPDLPARMFGIEIGVVVDRADPKGLGRVKVRIPGVIDDASAWAFPLGTSGGAMNRGDFRVPIVGAEVAVWFKGGDVDRPYYMGAHWGLPGGVSEVPEAAEGGDPEIQVMGFGPYDLTVDERGGQKKFRISDRSAPNDCVIEFDGTNRTLAIRSTVGISIESSGIVEIRGLQVSINGVPAGSGKL
jgi:hypothetical protein